MHGGDYGLYPELTRYINEVGQRLAAVSDRKLPFEFTVLNNSKPNAWALPGGKIAINRGLLMALKSEAELAVVKVNSQSLIPISKKGGKT
jgi:predicted Zn-dependent protease